ncbi:hypothetical protein MtrunA17_Chr1g0192051 [Medicago truncatula]|uniref:Uncharacterized protein n=2 Tax=Medicago truncatula TaxID=3880 RepID=A0A396JR87_MEDTR|nr:hypothetical protein MtrunA17_Chr1g0192051 [Medicago truncatula]
MVEKHQGKAVEKHEDTWSTNQDGVASAKISKVAFDDKGKESSEEKTKRFEPVDAASKRPLVMALPSQIHETSHCILLEGKNSIDVKHDGNVILLVPRDGGEAMEKHEDTWSINQDGVAEAKISKVGFKDKDKGSLEEKTKRFEPIVAASKRPLVMALPSLIHETSHYIHLESKTSIDVKHDGNVIPSVPHDGVLKKINVQKRPTDDLNSEFSAVGEKRRKTTSSHVEKPSTSEKFAHPSGKVDVSASKFLHVCRRLLYELKTIALDPFHGVKRKIHSIVIKFFLRFRSLAYQKCLLLSPPTKNEAPEVRATKSPDDHASALLRMKPVKHIVQPDNPSKAARKRAATDRQEEIDAKRLKKMKALKASDTEKKAATQAPPKVVKPGSTGKVERPAMRFEPTELTIKFPPMTSLPSVAELKARFARFGPIHQSSLRVSSKSSTCRVVFFRKIDAQAAHTFAVANQSLFGNADVRYFLKELELSSPNISEVAKASEDIGANETQPIKDPAVVQQPLPKPMIHLKSILKKKSNRDVLGQGTSKRTQRVKFMLAGEESSRGNRNNSNLDDGSAHSSVAKGFNTKNVQKVISQPSLPILPFHTQSAKTTQHNLHNFEMAPIHTPNFTNTGASTSTTTVDISQQMMGLLTRCHGVVTNLTSSGYVPYRPL